MKQIDNCMRSIIGAKGEELPMKVMKKGHARNTHDSIFWASTFAAWSFQGKVRPRQGVPVYNTYYTYTSILL
jgi:hypothetical protein